MPMYDSSDKVEAGTSVIDSALDADALFVPEQAPLTLPDGTVPESKGSPSRRFSSSTQSSSMTNIPCRFI